MPAPRATVLLALCCACGGSVRVEQPQCPYELRGECVGVPMSSVCPDDFCTEDASCTQVVEVSDDQALAAALADASPGTCLALAPGDYQQVALPEGVSLLGRSADDVRVLGVTVGGGSGALLRGIEIGMSGLVVDGHADLTMHAVRVARSSFDGIRLEGNARLAMSRSEVVAPGERGIRAVDLGALVMTYSALSDTPVAGLWAQCAMGCDCPEAPPVALERVLVKGAGTYGLALIGVSARLQTSDVLDTRPGPDFQMGAGLGASGCSEVTLEDVHIDKSAGVGLLIDESDAELGVKGAGIVVARASQGVIITHIASQQQVSMVEAAIEDNGGLGICVGGFSAHVSIQDSSISRTHTILVPLAPAGSAEIGDGIEWTAGSEVRIDGLTLRSSERQSILIDGPVPASSRIDNLVLAGGDEDKGIVQQKVLNSSDAPVVGPGVPPVKQEYEPLWDLACP
ncbi:MAG TPA: hypothetical protein VFB62_23255 [Polyangiaceae bacterium]|jgi:hypothetical protein|nr:hypothetical protein [Polyangiaceae bacterium]